MTCFRLQAIVLLVSGLLFADRAFAQPEPSVSKPDPEVEKVRNKLNFSLDADAIIDRIPLLVEQGEKLFPAFEVILKDPKSTKRQVWNALLILCDQGMEKTDRRRFLELAIAKLTDADPQVRINAVGLIRRIGSERDTAPVVALLSDENTWVGITAADTLVAIGGKRDLVAMDVWLKSGAVHREHRTYPEYVKGCRDKLEKRLKEVEKDRK